MDTAFLTQVLLMFLSSRKVVMEIKTVTRTNNGFMFLTVAFFKWLIRKFLVVRSKVVSLVD